MHVIPEKYRLKRLRFEAIKHFIPFRYVKEVSEELERQGYPKDYLRTSIPPIKCGHRRNDAVLDALIHVAEKYKKEITEKYY